jgi:hypothetical protein
MNGRGAAVEGAQERDSWRGVFWFFAFGGTLFMLMYEYAWARFALYNPAISFGGWVGTSLEITAPWGLCLFCVSKLKEAAANGKIDPEVRWEVSVGVEALMVVAYLSLAPAIHRLPSLGALK